MSNLITNGNFSTQDLLPWTSIEIPFPVFTKHKQDPAYSLLLPAGTDFQQLITVPMEAKDFTLNWKISARIDPKINMGAWLFILLSTRQGNDLYYTNSLFTDLTNEWKTFSHQSTRLFPAQNDGLYMQVISANHVSEHGLASADIEVTNIELYADYVD